MSDDVRSQDAIGLGVVATILAVVNLAAIWTIDYLPTNDGPQHLFAVWARMHLDDPTWGYSRYLERGAAISNLGFDLLYRAALAFLDWRPALRLVLSVMGMTWGLAGLALARALDPRRAWLGLVGFAAAFQWSLYMGLFSYNLGAALGLLAIALACRPSAWTPRGRSLQSAVVLVTAVSHVFCGALTGAIVASLGLARAGSGRRVRELGLIAAMLAPAVALVLAAAGADRRVYSGSIWGLADRALLVGRAFLSGPPWRAWPVVAIAIVAAVLALRARIWRSDHRQAVLLIAGLACLAVAGLAPVHLPTWQFFSPRFTPFGLILLVALLPIERLAGHARRMAHGALFAYALAGSLWALTYNRALAAGSRDALAGLDAPVRRNGPRLDVIIEAQGDEPWDLMARTVPFATPHYNLGLLYAIAQGGVPTRLFLGDTAQHTLAHRAHPDGPTPDTPPAGYARPMTSPRHVDDWAQRRARLVDLASYAPGYDDMILYGRPPDRAVLAALGFAFDFTSGGLVIARFVGCPSRLVVTGLAAGDASPLLDTAWRDGGRIARVALTPVRSTPERAEFPLPSPCGDFLLRAFVDRDRDGKPSRGDALCEGIDRYGFLHASLVDAGRTIECRLR